MNKNTNDRRKFIKRAATAATIALTPLSAISASISISEEIEETGSFKKIPKPCSPQSWVKKGKVIEPDYASGHRFIQNFNSPAEPLGNGRWRIWYCANPPKPDLPNIAIAEGIPGEKMVTHFAQLSEGEPADAYLSIGNLPEGWRPVQPVHIKIKNGRHRLYFWVHGSGGIVRYLAADSEDGKRYKLIDPYKPCLYHFHDRAVEFVGTTPAGLKLEAKSDSVKKRNPRPANEPAAVPELICNDGTSVYQLDDGSFEMYVISLMSLEKGDPRWASNDNLAGYVRVIDRLISKDGLQWYGRKTVVQPDFELDPIDQQFYYLNVTYTPEGRVGMLGHYRVKDQTVDIEWCFSRNGIHWERPYRNRPWIARGWPGDPDSLGIYPSTQLVYDQNKWSFFYTACNYIHNRKLSHGEPASLIMLAETSSIWKKG